MQNSSVKVALITGAARRIGAATAAYLHQLGLNIGIHYNHSQREAEELCAQLNQVRPDSAALFHGNLEDLKCLDALIAQAVSAWGRLDVLVNNASKFYPTKIGGITETAWLELMNANLQAPLFLSQAAAPHLTKTRGCIVNITDIHGDRPMRDYSVYCISKAGLIMMTKALAAELGPDVRVNAVSPGAIMWPEGENELTSELKEKIISRTALNRPGTPEAIAKTVGYLVNEAEYVTGQVIAVDGGRSLMI